MTKLERYKKIRDQLLDAIDEATLTGGVKSYTIETGQSTNKVVNASLPELQNMLNYYEYKINELENFNSGLNIMQM